MLASIVNMDKDIEIFLTEEEVRKLESQSLKGKIFEFQDVRNLYRLEVLIDSEQYQKKSNFKIGTEIQDNKYLVYISQDYYKRLQEVGGIGTRYGFIKIDLMKESFVNENEEFAGDLRRIKLHLNRNLTKSPKAIWVKKPARFRNR